MSQITQAQTGQVKVIIENLETPYGEVQIGLFEQAGFPEKGKEVSGKIVPVCNKEAVCLFENLPVGNYAASAFHDLSGTGKMDRNWLGIPKEPYGFSNNIFGSFGPPNFEDVRFEVRENEITVITIRLKNFI